jgi:hypothetical protein
MSLPAAPGASKHRVVDPLWIARFFLLCLPVLVPLAQAQTGAAGDERGQTAAEADATGAEEELTPELQTNWLEFVKGDREDTLGAEVREVSTDPGTGRHRLLIAVPKIAMDEYPRAMEEVRVIGERPEEPELLPDFEYEWIEDYDNDFYGLLLRFREGQQLPFRLFFSSEAGFLQP